MGKLLEAPKFCIKFSAFIICILQGMYVIEQELKSQDHEDMKTEGNLGLSFSLEN